MPERPAFVDEHLLQIGDVELHCAFPFGGAPAGRLEVMKPRRTVERYFALCDDLRPRRIVELGINRGGSTVLLRELTSPEKLVAIELDPAPVPLLEAYIDERGLADVVRPHHGVDQADREALRSIVAAELGDGPLDLVVDDASHLYEPSLASFETLFGHLRPGGLYVIEDWSWQHRYSDGIARTLAEDTDEAEALRSRIAARLDAEAAGERRDPPLTRLVVELVHLRARTSDLVAELTVDEQWVTIRRGTEPIDPDTFRVADHYLDHFGFLG